MRSAVVCYACAPGSYLYNESCVLECPNGLYANGTDCVSGIVSASSTAAQAAHVGGNIAVVA